MNRIVLTLALLMTAFSGWAAAAEPRIRVSVTVRDETGAPVPAAYVGVIFDKFQGSQTLSGRTDAAGTAQVTGRTEFGVSVVVRKDGYYESRFGPLAPYTVTNRQQVFADQAVTIGLRPIRNPIPMYARFRYETRLPVVDTPVGFDLMEGAWVAPHGKGRTADMLFRIAGFWKSPNDYNSTLTLTFPNAGDGLVPFEGHPTSRFISPYEAPLTGYQPQKVWRRSSRVLPGPRPGPLSPTTERVDEASPRANYVFRVRTIRNPDGTIRSALYGKLYGDPEFLGPDDAGKNHIVLTYYLNPTPNDRNLEFDPQRNLATGLNSFERPTQP